MLFRSSLVSRQCGWVRLPVPIQAKAFEQNSGLFQRFLGILGTQQQFFGHAPGKKLRARIVGAKPDFLPPFPRRDDLSVDGDSSLRLPGQAGQREGQTGLARAVSPGQGDHAAVPQGEVDVFQNDRLPLTQAKIRNLQQGAAFS